VSEAIQALIASKLLSIFDCGVFLVFTLKQGHEEDHFLLRNSLLSDDVASVSEGNRGYPEE
jgi:hypothetical protein